MVNIMYIRNVRRIVMRNSRGVLPRGKPGGNWEDTINTSIS